MQHCVTRYASVRALLNALGGVQQVADRHGWPVNTVESWAKPRRNSIPVDHWPVLCESAEGLSIALTADDLMRACAAPKGKSDTQNGQGEAA